MNNSKTQPHPIGFKELLALVALTMSLVAMSIDIMLPALHAMGQDLGVTQENDFQEIITIFLLGFAAGQLVYGPLADRHGRKPWLLAGLGLYCLASVSTLFVDSFSLILLCRFVQGVGTAAARVIPIAIVRDCYVGTQMARMMSFVIMVFVIVPIFAPAIGQGILWFGSWHMIFLFLLADAALLMAWIALRLPETLHPQYRRAISLKVLWEACRLTVYTRQSMGYTVAMALLYGCLMTYIANAAQIFKDIYQLDGQDFPLAFGVIAATLIPASYTNAHWVGQLGLRRLSHAALLSFVLGCAGLALWSLIAPPSLITFCAMMSATLFFFAWTFPNFNALAMEPLGSIAGTAASFIGFFVTALAAVLAWGIGQAFNGTVIPLALGFALFSSSALLTVWWTEQRKLFQFATDIWTRKTGQRDQ
ncbi:MAG: multidrug effflux MFS transporter [Gammaproteobacteria bacterium]|nr:multidrug effflux MFS transporter [Gammaproteobacteria bacterium]